MHNTHKRKKITASVSYSLTWGKTCERKKITAFMHNSKATLGKSATIFIKRMVSKREKAH